MDHGFGLPAPLSFDVSPKSIFAQDRNDDADDRSWSVTDRSRFWPDDAAPAYDRTVRLDFSGELRWLTVSVRNNRVVSYLLRTDRNDTFLGSPLDGNFSTGDTVRFPEKGVSISPFYRGRVCDICWRDLRFWRDVTDGLLTDGELPDGFAYPWHFLDTYRRGLITLDPWRILSGRRLRALRTLLCGTTDGSAGTRQYVPFAGRADTGQVACWDHGAGTVRVLTDPRAGDNRVTAEYPGFLDWLRQAFKDLAAGMSDAAAQVAEQALEPPSAGPDGYPCPAQVDHLCRLGLTDLEPWAVLDTGGQEFRAGMVAKRWSGTCLLPFAARTDRDDVVCVDRRTGELLWVDPYDTPVFECADGDRFASFDDWLRMAVDDYIDCLREEASR